MGTIQNAAESFLRAGLLEGQHRAGCDVRARSHSLAVQFFGNGNGIAIRVAHGVAIGKGRVLLPQLRAARVRNGRRSVHRYRAIIRDGEFRGKNKSGADAVGVVVAPVAVAAIRLHTPDAVRAVGVRRPEPPHVIGDTLAVATGATSEIVQLCAIFREIAVVTGRPADLVARQKEHFGRKAARASGKAAAATRAVLVRDFNLLDGRSNFGINQVVEGAVQVRMNARVLIGVTAAECGCGVNVLEQNPRSVAGIVVDTGRLTLMNNNEILGRAVDLDFNGATDGFRAQFYVCHIASLQKIRPTA